jgi:hypothetical protein
LFLIASHAMAQFKVSGTVYDSSKIVPVQDVLVKSSGGSTAKTDSMGHYSILVNSKDSICFIYHSKPTSKFAVKEIPNTQSFDLSLHIRVFEKYKTLKEVRVFGRSYRQDSAENREEYEKEFGYEKPGIATSGTSDYSGTPGLDLDEFIDIFRFRHNKLQQGFQKRLVDEEQEKYVNYRFNKYLIHRITNLISPDIDTFMIRYRPNYNFVVQSSLPEFYQYILDASYQFKNDLLLQKRKAGQ